MEPFPYDFTVREFAYNGAQYKVVLTPELYPGDGDLDFTGNYLGLLISSNKGSKSFQLTVDDSLKWQSEPKGMDSGLIDELDNIIQEIRKK